MAKAVSVFFPLLPAFSDEKLSPEGAEQLVRMAKDETVSAQGKDLPLADRDVLLNAARARREVVHANDS